MNTKHQLNSDFETFTDELAQHRSNADLARGQVLAAGWRFIANFFRNGAARIVRVNMIRNSNTAPQG